MSSRAALVAPRFNPVTVNEFTRLEIRCDNVVPSNVGQAQIFNPDGEMVGVSSYTVADATREFAGTYSCVATSRIDPNITATTTAEVIIQRNNYMAIMVQHACIHSYVSLHGPKCMTLFFGLKYVDTRGALGAKGLTRAKFPPP